MRLRTSIESFMTSKPPMRATPLVAGRYVVRMRMMVVLPAPLLPRRPTISPFSTVNVTSLAAMTAGQMVAAVKEATKDWKYDVVSIGYPGPVANNKILKEPVNLGKGWVNFDFSLLGKPYKIINDAAMQALGSYEGGRMLFLGLGTGLGATLILDGMVGPLEIAHLPYRKGRSYENYLGEAASKRAGTRKWQGGVVLRVVW